MKNVVLGSLFLATTSLVGCVVLEPGTITATVALDNAGPGALGACQPDNDAIRLNAVSLDGNDDVYSLFNCDDTVVTTAVLDGGDYEVWLDYVHDDFTPGVVADDDIVGSTASIVVELNGDLALDATILMDRGFFTTAIELQDGGGNPLTCAQVPDENGISFLTTATGTTDGVETLVNCEDGAVFSEPLGLGEYTVIVAVLNSADESLGDSGDFQATIPNGNDYIDVVAPITLD